MRGLASTIIAEFMFNNSADNAKNPHHPPRRVVNGNKADDEMGNIFLQVTPCRSDQRARLVEDFHQRELRLWVVGHRKTLEQYPA